MVESFDASRRRFVRGLAGAASAWPLLGLCTESASAQFATASDSGQRARPTPVLEGTEFDLEIGSLGVNLTGVPRVATVVNGQLPGPLLRWREGDTVTIRVANRLSAPTSIHWHGVLVPADMDGVPGISFNGIGPGATFSYRFTVEQAGTYWYHSHSRFQEQIGLYGPIIIEPRGGERHAADREHVILLSDWADCDPEHLYRTLKLHSDYYNFARLTAGDFFSDVRAHGLRATLAARRPWGRMRMSPTDLADISGHAYTYLMNGAPPAANWTGLFQPGEKVRLRFINGSSMTYFDVRIPGLKLSVIAADGQDIEPVPVDEFRIGAGEVYDVLVEPDAARSYAIFAQALDRSGYAFGTLAPREGMKTSVPPLDPRPLLGSIDAHDARGIRWAGGSCRSDGSPGSDGAHGAHGAHP